jgi:starch synthase
MNLIIDDIDHPLIIKVASIQIARLQVYFIDNEDYFLRKNTFTDDKGKFFDDNDERAIFYSRGVLETVKKLGWGPDIVHCHGWFSSLVPMYIKRSYKDVPLFSDSKVITSVYDDEFTAPLNKDFAKKVKFEGVTDKDTKHYKQSNYVGMMKSAIDFSDGVIYGSEKINPELDEYIKSSGKPALEYMPVDTYIDAYDEFYNELLINEAVLM